MGITSVDNWWRTGTLQTDQDARDHPIKPRSQSDLTDVVRTATRTAVRTCRDRPLTPPTVVPHVPLRGRWSVQPEEVGVGHGAAAPAVMCHARPVKPAVATRSWEPAPRGRHRRREHRSGQRRCSALERFFDEERGAQPADNAAAYPKGFLRPRARCSSARACSWQPHRSSVSARLLRCGAVRAARRRRRRARRCQSVMIWLSFCVLRAPGPAVHSHFGNFSI